MRPEYRGVKFYDKNDMSIGLELQKAEPIILSFSETKIYDNINEVIELYNILNLINTNIPLSSWTDEQYKEYKSIVKKFEKIIGKFFSKINDENFIEQNQSVAYPYLDDFWTLFVRYKMYKRISPEVILNYLQLPDTTLYKLLEHEKLVDCYGIQLADVMRKSDQTVRILVSKFLEKSKLTCFIPKELKPCEFEPIFLKYIESGQANPNTLCLISQASSQKECPISDKLRLKARHEFERFWEERANNGLMSEWMIGVRFDNQEEIIEEHQEGENWLISYDVNWFEENLDFPTILNNYWHVFEMFDPFCRSSLVSVRSKIGALEKVFMTNGVKFYHNGYYFRTRDIISTGQTSLYYDFLKQHGIELDDVFKWFFEIYMPEEFGANGFSFSVSTPTATYVERCRNLASEMDGVLKQFRMFVQDGEIDRELYEMSSGHVIFSTIPSLISDKYAYPNSSNIQKEMFALFSDQSPLSVTKKTTTKYSTLSKMLQSEEMALSDFAEYQQSNIKWLIDKECLSVSEKGILELVYPKAWILRDIYEHDVICLYKCREWATTLKTMILEGDLKTGSTLFTEPESEFLNYKLNKAEFSNGLDLRNKYSHATYPQDMKEQKRDYIELLKIMVLIITKINDEFCYRDL